MDVVPAVGGVLLVAATAVLLTATLRVRGVAEAVAAALVVAASTVVGTCIALSLVHLLTRPALLACAAALAIAAALLWMVRGRPWPAAPREARPVRLVRSDPATALLALAAALALCLQAFMAVAVAPNEFDALLYHLPRAAYWVQAHSALQLTPAAVGDPRAVSPPNAELLSAWTMALSRSDKLVQLVQWLSLVGLACTVFTGARLLAFGRRAALFAASLVAVLPELVLQAATPQTDLAVTFFLAASGVFAVRGLRDRRGSDLAVSALAAGLAVGTKGSALIAAPSLAIVVLGAAWRYRPPRRLLIGGACGLLAAVAALGAFNYVQNIERTGSLTGGATQAVAQDFAKEHVSAGLPTRVAQVTWNFVDAPGLSHVDWLKARLRSVAALIFPEARSDHPPPLKTDVLPDETAFGPVGLLLFLPLLAWALFARRSPRERRLVAAAALLYLVLFAATLGYSSEAARLIMPMVAIGAPLFALLHRLPALRWMALVLALAGVVPTLVLDQYKPLLLSGESSILNRGRLDQRLIDSDLSPHEGAIRKLATLVPANGRVGFRIQLEPDVRALDYVLFGPRLERRVTPVPPRRLAQAVRTPLAGVVLWRRGRSPLPPQTRATRLGDGSLLLRPVRP